MFLQTIHNIPEICAQLGITDAVLSPGSRCAPLTIAFARHPGITVRTVPDERAAAFIGLGLAQAQRRAVALVCTSGTAGLNYAPAVAEAFFQQVPLVVFTADRPPEWIDQLDGQTIRQTNLYGAHAKGAFTLPVDLSHPDAKWHATRLVNEAINLAHAAPAGPVQVNVPLREPFYPQAGEELTFDSRVKVIREVAGVPVLPADELTALAAALRENKRVVVVAGQHPREPELQRALRQFTAAFEVTIVGDTIANIFGADTTFIDRQDIFLAGLNTEQKQALAPDLLITFGQSLISKSLKLFLRAHRPTQHWHVQASGYAADTFQSLTRILRTTPTSFFTSLALVAGPTSTDKTSYNLGWSSAQQQGNTALRNFFDNQRGRYQETEEPFNEFSAIRQALAFLPNRTALHLANSMAVRYANILGVPHGRQIEVFSNRGTSGIDGCTSTAVGAALAQPGRPVVLLTGDVAFFYDRNAFWQNYPTPNLRVILLNNHAGGIFRLIDGPRQQPELEEFFETRQPLRAENTARDFGLRYFAVSTFSELELALPVFFAAKGGAALLEITTDSVINAAFFEYYRNAVKTAFS